MLDEYSDITDRIQKMKTATPDDIVRLKTLRKDMKEEAKKKQDEERRRRIREEEESSDDDIDDDDDDNNEDDGQLKHESTIKASSINGIEPSDTVKIIKKPSTASNEEVEIVEDNKVSELINAINTDDEDDEFKEMLNEYDDINSQLQKMNSVKHNLSISNSLKDFYADLGISPTIKSTNTEKQKNEETKNEE